MVSDRNGYEIVLKVIVEQGGSS